jgi:hypothetical protein
MRRGEARLAMSGEAVSERSTSMIARRPMPASGAETATPVASLWIGIAKQRRRSIHCCAGIKPYSPPLGNCRPANLSIHRLSCCRCVCFATQYNNQMQPLSLPGNLVYLHGCKGLGDVTPISGAKLSSGPGVGVTLTCSQAAARAPGSVAAGLAGNTRKLKRSVRL